MVDDNNSVFHNNTLKYRINGFAHACRMENLNLVESTGILFNTLGNKKHKDDNDIPIYLISITKGKNEVKNIYFSTIKGQYDDLSFVFTNYFTKKIMNKKIYDIPFEISLVKNVDKYIYDLSIETVNKEETRFTIRKYRELRNETLSSKLVFYANIMDFSNILKLVKSFVYNPELVFLTYNEINEQKKTIFTANSVNKGIMEDINLDKPCNKIAKLVKRITNTK